MIAKQKNSFAKGAAWLATSALLLKIIGLIYKIPLSYMLGDEGMGYFNSAYTVYIFFYVIGTAGIPKAISIIVSKKEAEVRGYGYSVFKSAFLTFSVGGLALLSIFIFCANFFARAVGNEKSVVAMYAIAPSILFVCASGVVRGYLSGKMKFEKIAISELISGVLKLVLGLMFAYIASSTGKSLPTIAGYTILGITLGSLGSLIYLCLSLHEEENSDISLSKKDLLGEILKIAIPITLASALGSVVNILDLTVMMSGLVSDGFDSNIANILYGNYTTLAVPMVSLVSTLLSPITTAMLPLLTVSLAQRNAQNYNDHLYDSLWLASVFYVPAAIVFAFFPTELLSLIFEKSSAVVGAPLLMSLAPAVLFLGPLTVLNTSIEAAEKPTIVLLSLGAGAVVKLLVGLFLLKYTDVGVLAAPLGTSLSYFFSYCISKSYLHKLNRIKFVVIKSARMPLIASLIALTVSLFIKRIAFVSIHSRLSSLVLGIVFSLCYFISLILISPKAQNALFKCVKMNKKQTKRL